MKLIASCLKKLAVQMPPTRGHDLKLMLISGAWILLEMPPTRGHDLKLLMNVKTAATS